VQECIVGNDGEGVIESDFRCQCGSVVCEVGETCEADESECISKVVVNGEGHGQSHSEAHGAGHKEVECADASGWVDSLGNTCGTYTSHGWCTVTGGHGDGWKADVWGQFDRWKSPDGRSAKEACCGCGGGRVVSDDKHGGHGGHAEGGHEEHHSHDMPLLFFVLVTLSIGCGLQVVQERFLPSIPYTCMLFVLGMFFAVVHQFRPDKVRLQESHNTWYYSVEMWENMDPHVLFHTFLPALIFADAMKMNGKLISKVFTQVLILACPGVLIGTFATAYFVQNAFPYEWPFKLCVLFGAITAATDPVAVVALFNTLGVSPRLTMLVSGESLLNDGTAIVLFQLTLKVLLSGEGLLDILAQSNSAKDPTPDFAGKFIVGVVFVALLFGMLVATAFQILIFSTAETRYHSDAMIQVTVTICVAYVCFWFTEHELGASGVLAVVFAGGVFSVYSWPRFASKEAMHIVWEAIEFLGNTMIFTLGGLLFGAGVLAHNEQAEIMFEDFGMLLLLYLGSTVIRGLMIVLLSPVMNLVGDPVTVKEMIVMTWSGLRGAVAIVLAIMVDLEPGIDSQDRARFMFHIGGMAMLTTLVNAPLAKPLLQYLGMTHTPMEELRANTLLEDASIDHIRNKYKEITAPDVGYEKRDDRFYGHDESELKMLVPYVSDEGEAMSGVLTEKFKIRMWQTSDDMEEKVVLCRQMFMRILQAKYWEDIDEGVIPKASRIARHLIFSTQDNFEDSHVPLHDWSVISESAALTAWPMMGSIVELPPFGFIFPLLEMFPTEERSSECKVRVILSYLQGHKSTREKMRSYFEATEELKSALDMVCQESEEQCRKAEEILKQEVQVEYKQKIQSKMLAGMLIHHHLHKVAGMQEEGLITQKGAQEIAHHLQHKYRSVAGHAAAPVKNAAGLNRNGSQMIALAHSGR
jgi:NhaP-type Na+/H+ or K+/H+ antiporter